MAVKVLIVYCIKLSHRLSELSGCPSWDASSGSTQDSSTDGLSLH